MTLLSGSGQSEWRRVQSGFLLKNISLPWQRNSMTDNSLRARHHQWLHLLTGSHSGFKYITVGQRKLGRLWLSLPICMLISHYWVWFHTSFGLMKSHRTGYNHSVLVNTSTLFEHGSVYPTLKQEACSAFSTFKSQTFENVYEICNFISSSWLSRHVFSF